MTKKYVVVETNNMDGGSYAREFTDCSKATAYLFWKWKTCYEDAIKGGYDVDEESCYHGELEAKVAFTDGCYEKFQLSDVVSIEEDFPEDWEKYAWGEKKKYRVTWEIAVDVEAENEYIATELADEVWAKGGHNVTPYIEEIE